MAKVMELLSCQGALRGLIERSLTNFGKIAKDKRTEAVIRSRLESLQSYWAKFQAQHAQLDSIADDLLRQDEYFVKDVFSLTADAFDAASDHYCEQLAIFRKPISPIPGQLVIFLS